MKSQNKEILYGLYDDDEDLLKAVKAANKDHLEIVIAQGNIGANAQ